MAPKPTASPTSSREALCHAKHVDLGAPFRRPTKQLLVDLVPSFPIKHYLIDDGWQDVPDRKLFSFHEWSGMTAPMAEVVSALKDKGANQVGVWVTMQGYWLGIHPDSPLKSRYDCQSHPVARWGQPRGGVNVPLKKGDGEQWFPSPEKAGRFWEDWFSEMKSWGITFVKVSLELSVRQDPDIGTERVPQPV